MKQVFITGGTGFLGSKILENLLGKKYFVYLLTRKHSNTNKPEIERKNIKEVKGDITKKNLGLTKGDINLLKDNVTYVFHCAALYDTSQTRSQLLKNNFEGTKNVSKLTARFRKLIMFNYMSTIYVSGSYEGVFPEDKLPSISKFHNKYEESKYQAEKLLRRTKLPLNIFRLPILVGNSKTGITSKFDGVYKLIQAIDNRRVFFYPGDCHGRLHIMPVDIAAQFVTEVGLERSDISKTYNMIDPSPSTYKEFIQRTADLLSVSTPFFVFPMSLWDTALKLMDKIPFINTSAFKLLNQRIEFENHEYMVALKKLGFENRDIKSYLAKIVSYYKKIK